MDSSSAAAHSVLMLEDLPVINLLFFGTKIGEWFIFRVKSPWDNLKVCETKIRVTAVVLYSIRYPIQRPFPSQVCS